jgi:hypothetical protein
MNTNNKILWAVLAVVVLGGLWYWMYPTAPEQGASLVATSTSQSQPTTEQQAAQPTTPRTAAPKPAGTVQRPAVPAKTAGVGPISSLYNLKESLLCSIRTTVGTVRSGTMYIAERKMRASFSNAVMIDDGTYLYTWKTGASTGLKLLSAMSVSGSAMANYGGFDPATNIAYSCNPWTEDASVFVAPASVSFTNTI